MLWQEQSWPRIREVDKRIPVVVPLGSLEQHGPHLPLIVDTLQVTAIAEAAERRLADRVLLLPTLWLGSSHHHLDFPGTVSLLPSLYSQVIESIALSILQAGFRRVVFLNGHGGNKVPVAQALSELVCGSEIAEDAYLALATWWELNPEAFRVGMETPAVSHSCEYETSLVLALRPDLVRMDRARKTPMALDNEWVKTESPQSSRVSIYRRFRRLTAPGSMGSPLSASAEKGKRLLAAVVEELVRFLTDISEWPELPPLGPDLG